MEVMFSHVSRDFVYDFLPHISITICVFLANYNVLKFYFSNLITSFWMLYGTTISTLCLFSIVYAIKPEISNIYWDVMIKLNIFYQLINATQFMILFMLYFKSC